MGSMGHPDPDAGHPLEIRIVGDQMDQLTPVHDGQDDGIARQQAVIGAVFLAGMQFTVGYIQDVDADLSNIAGDRLTPLQLLDSIRVRLEIGYSRS